MKIAKGRPRKFAEYEAFYKALPSVMTKRPKYFKGIGVFRGATGDTAWVKLSLPNGAVYHGRSYLSGSSLEIKLGRLSSWSWERLVEKHTELQGKADRGEPLQDRPLVTFTDCATDWCERAMHRTKSYETLEIHVRIHLLPTFGPKALSTVTVNDVDRWISKQLENLEPGTVQRQFNTLRAIFNDSIRAGHISENPCSKAQKIRRVQGRQRFLTGAELSRLLTSAAREVDWLPDYILWAVHSGMRKSEIRRLTWKDVRVLKEQILISIPKAKSDQSRIVVATQTMKEILDRQRRRQIVSDLRVFPISAITLRRKWEAARVAANLSDVTLHDLRRTHSTHAVAAGVDLRTLAERLGHTDLSMLQRHYAVVSEPVALEAAKKIETAIRHMVI